MKRIGIIGVCAAFVLLVAACGGGGAQSVSGDDVAVVGDGHITQAEWNALIEQTKNNFKATHRKFPAPGSVDLANLKTNATQFLIQSSEYEQEAKKLGVNVSDKDVDARLEQIKKQYYGNPAGQKQATQAQMDKRYQQALKQQGFTDEQVRSGIKQQLVREKVFNDVTKDVKVSDSDITSYYNKNKKQYETPAQPPSRDVRHILVGSKKKADDIELQLKAGGDFAALAKKYSTDTTSAVKGGELTIQKGKTVPEFDKKAFELKTKEISAPVHTQYGWHIIQALGPVKPAATQSLKDVSSTIRQNLLQTKKTAAFQKWLDGVKKDYAKSVSYAAGYVPQATGTTATTTAPATTG